MKIRLRRPRMKSRNPERGRDHVQTALIEIEQIAEEAFFLLVALPVRIFAARGYIP